MINKLFQENEKEREVKDRIFYDLSDSIKLVKSYSFSY